MKTPRDIFEELVLNPILSHRPKSIPEEDYLEEIFCLKTRPIGRYHCFADIDIKGNKIDGNKTMPEETYRLKHQEHIIARTDDTRPETVDLESERHGVIRIDADQWERVKTRCWKGTGHDHV